MNDEKQIWYLIKFFKEKEHAEQFMSGSLYMNRLSYFKTVENGDDGRFDTNEAVSHWWQPKGLILKINTPGTGEIIITDKDLAAPVAMSLELYDDYHIFCMYALWTDGFECIGGKIEYDNNESEKLKSQLKIDERCFKFGDYAVVVPAVQFIERTRQTITRINKTARLNLVRYLDGNKFNGEVKISEIPFSKLNEFSYQNEFRICLDNQTKGKDSFTLQIGSIKEFSAMVQSSNLNELFNIESIKAESNKLASSVYVNQSS